MQFISDTIKLKYENIYIEELPDIITKFIINNKDYHKIFLQDIYTKEEMIKYIVLTYSTDDTVTHAYIMEKALEYIKSKIPKEVPKKVKYIQLSIFDDGSKLC